MAVPEADPLSPEPTKRTHSGATGWEAVIPLDWNRLVALTNEPVPSHLKRWWFCLGGTPAYLLLIQITTGILLTFYYQPSPEQAYESVQRITYGIPFGWYLRGIHKWSANLMIVTLMLHMLRVFFTRAYRHPRRINWVFGVALLGLTLTLGFTGYSLIYEQLSFWGATVAANLTEAVPLVGHAMATFLRGGPEVDATTLTRLYVLHVGILPAAIIAVLGLHITFVRLHGVTEYEFERPDADARTGRAATKIGVGLIAIACLLTAAAAAIAALRGRPGFDFIGHVFGPTASRVIWAIGVVAMAVAAVAVLRRRLAGLLLVLTAAVLALGKLGRDLLLGEARFPAAWAAMAVGVLMLLIVALVLHRRFTVGEKADEPATFNFFPDHAMTELLIGTGLLFLLTILVLLFPAGLGEKANPNMTPDHIKPEWYFFFQFRLLKISPGLAGMTALQVSVLLTGVLMAALVLWPWIDAASERVAPGKDVSVYVGIVGFLWFLLFTVWEAMVE